MKLPRTIAIGDRLWRVVLDKRLELPLRDRRLLKQIGVGPKGELWGFCNHRRRQLHISAHLSERDRWSTFVHELLHAAIPSSFPLTEAKEEAVITRPLTLRTLDGSEPTSNPEIIADRRAVKQFLARVAAGTACASQADPKIRKLLALEKADRERRGVE